MEEIIEKLNMLELKIDALLDIQQAMLEDERESIAYRERDQTQPL